MSYNHLDGIVLDIETLGTTPNSIILSIGACRVDIYHKRVYDEFLVNIDAIDSKKYGMIAEPKTVEWWSKQNPVVMRGLRKDAVPLKEAMERFHAWASKTKNVSAWSWGSAFDFPCIEWSMRAVGIQQTPWHYRNVKCLRTVAEVFGESIKRDKETQHNALADAKDQAKFVIDLFNELTIDQDIPF